MSRPTHTKTGRKISDELTDTQALLAAWLSDEGQSLISESSVTEAQRISKLLESAFIAGAQKTMEDCTPSAFKAEVWKKEYINEVKKHVALHNQVYSGEFGIPPEGKIYDANAVATDAVNVIEDEISKHAELPQGGLAYNEINRLKSALSELHRACHSVVGFIQSNQDRERLVNVMRKTPAQHLAEIKAEAGRAGYLQGMLDALSGPSGKEIGAAFFRADEYADEVRQGGV